MLSEGPAKKVADRRKGSRSRARARVRVRTGRKDEGLDKAKKDDLPYYCTAPHRTGLDVDWVCICVVVPLKTALSSLIQLSMTGGWDWTDWTGGGTMPHASKSRAEHERRPPRQIQTTLPVFNPFTPPHPSRSFLSTHLGHCQPFTTFLNLHINFEDII